MTFRVILSRAEPTESRDSGSGSLGPSTLTIEWNVKNDDSEDAKEEFSFSNALHTYFHVGGIRKTVVAGLQGYVPRATRK